MQLNACVRGESVHVFASVDERKSIGDMWLAMRRDDYVTLVSHHLSPCPSMCANVCVHPHARTPVSFDHSTSNLLPPPSHFSLR